MTVGWQTPKLDWAVSSAPGPGDFNRIEENSLVNAVSSSRYNLSFECDFDGDGLPDGWEWSPFTGGTFTLDTSAIDGTFSAKIVHPGGSGNGGGRLLSDFIPIHKAVNNYFVAFALWSSAAGVRNDVELVFFDSGKNLISSISVYSSTSNPTSATFFISQVPSIPANANWCKIRLTGGNSATATGGTTRFDAVDLFQLFYLPNPSGGSVPTFGECAKASDTNFTDAVANLTVASSRGFRIGYIPCTITLTVKGGSTGIGAEFRLRCGSQYGDYYFLSTTNWAYVDVPLSIMISNPSSPITLAVQYRTRGADWVGVQRVVTSATIDVTTKSQW